MRSTTLTFLVVSLALTGSALSADELEPQHVHLNGFSRVKTESNDVAWARALAAPGGLREEGEKRAAETVREKVEPYLTGQVIPQLLSLRDDFTHQFSGTLDAENSRFDAASETTRAEARRQADRVGGDKRAVALPEDLQSYIAKRQASSSEAGARREASASETGARREASADEAGANNPELLAATGLASGLLKPFPRGASFDPALHRAFAAMAAAVAAGDGSGKTAGAQMDAVAEPRPSEGGAYRHLVIIRPLGRHGLGCKAVKAGSKRPSWLRGMLGGGQRDVSVLRTWHSRQMGAGFRPLYTSSPPERPAMPLLSVVLFASAIFALLRLHTICVERHAREAVCQALAEHGFSPLAAPSSPVLSVKDASVQSGGGKGDESSDEEH